MNVHGIRTHRYEVGYRLVDGAAGRILVAATSPRQAVAMANLRPTDRIIRVTREDDFTEDQVGYWV
jgi:hypothetical protein